MEAVGDVYVVGGIDGDAARAVKGGVAGPAVVEPGASFAPCQPARLAGGGGEGDSVERGAGGVEEEEVAGAGPREDCVGVWPGGRERVEVGEGGDRVTVLEDGFTRSEQRKK
jgi:hypothetical protein